MKHALIPPISLLKETEATEYQLMLPHLTKDMDYYDTYQEYGIDPQKYLILDNGVAEGEKIPFEELYAIGKHFHVDEIVLPDVMGDAVATLDAATEGYRYLSTRNWDKNIMYVAQGSTLSAVMGNIEEALYLLPRVTTIGLPRHLITTLDWFNVRWWLADNLVKMTLMNKKQIHFLGMNSAHIRELEYGKAKNIQSFVRSVDSSAPFNYAYYGIKMDNQGVQCSRPEGYFTQHEEAFEEMALIYNLQYMKEVAEG